MSGHSKSHVFDSCCFSMYLKPRSSVYSCHFYCFMKKSVFEVVGWQPCELLIWICQIWVILFEDKWINDNVSNLLEINCMIQGL
jgi:hypothetical protein